MPVIQLETLINAPAEVVFNLARSIDLHMISTAHTGEKAIAGRTSGLIGPGESVTWQARHFGFRQQLTSRITDYDPPRFFADEMVSGAFKSFRHEHHFRDENGTTVMTDVFSYKSPFSFLGRIADVLFLKNYMEKLLTGRNRVIKEFAEDPEKLKMVFSKS